MLALSKFDGSLMVVTKALHSAFACILPVRIIFFFRIVHLVRKPTAFFWPFFSSRLQSVFGNCGYGHVIYPRTTFPFRRSSFSLAYIVFLDSEQSYTNYMQFWNFSNPNL
jgi:hypothetical protein